jgi:hypothetical protein
MVCRDWTFPVTATPDQIACEPGQKNTATDKNQQEDLTEREIEVCRD